uniref:phosphatidylinositol 3-kinase n=1 Tax=Neogobius melanostomus TaxID=47308 RepID=A0A8C6TAG0_9GOBI
MFLTMLFLTLMFLTLMFQTDVSDPDVSDPDVSDPDVSTLMFLTLMFQTDVPDPDVSDPDVSDPDVSDPDVPDPDDSDERQQQQQLLTYLIGHDLEKEARDRLDELTFTRRKLSAPRRQELRRRDPFLYATEPWVSHAPLPTELQELLKRQLHVTIVTPHLKTDLSFFLIMIVQVCSRVLDDQGVAFDHQDALVLKVSGREEFLTGDERLSDFLWVRHCMKTHSELHLSVLHFSCLPDDGVGFVDWPPVDGFSGQFSSHQDLRLDRKELDDIFMISLWDCERKLRVKLLGFDVPKLPEKCPPSVYVEASLLYGSKVCSAVSSAARPFTEEVLWNEWLEFDVLLSDLPRGVKLGFTINSAGSENTPTRQDSKRNGKMLYFVNLLLIDHRSVLCQGPHTLHMWACPTQSEEEAVTFQADKLSSATNPDIETSVAISVMLDRYCCPVVLPNATQAQPNATQAQPNRPGCALPALRPPSVRAGLGNFREDSVLYGSNLPEFLRHVPWMDRQTVEDVHWLLENWGAPESLDLAVALELLSLDFIDHKVRRLAVRRLDCLSNDEVLKYLLQLVQTLKVEPYHDSFLARFLIRRALRSKRIGHFFFWYVRSEVLGCLFFRQRMAVLLEAYLLGCGHGMLDTLRQQVLFINFVSKLRLREFLQSSNLPSEFVLPFDPRVKVGNVILEKCKIMASKKKPLWLEFCPAPSPTSTAPVGVIFKHGDDLRQDMLVIQTLVLMDSIWQDKSLDLNLIPYGCIATGHNIGMIETVRDAVTIAAIQKSRGGSAGAFKEDALFDWLKSKCPLQEIHFQTVETFVKSCAGYCVATYVLGIGDRHNDNIMITDKGNLFHIDFGHILGNWKRVLGVNRERVPFVLTPDFLYIMGRVKHRNSLYFDHFQDICMQAYLSLRSQSHLLITLFSIMLLTGMRELSSAEDMRYLREVLQEGKSEEQARAHFLEQVHVCIKQGWQVQTNWWIHILMGIK